MTVTFVHIDTGRRFTCMTPTAVARFYDNRDSDDWYSVRGR